MKTYYLGTLLLLASTITSAKGIANNFEVDYVRVDSSGKGYVNFKTELVSEPASCAGGYRKALAFNTNTEGGKSILSVALTAKASGKRIYAIGSGDCSVYSVMESWAWGKI